MLARMIVSVGLLLALVVGAAGARTWRVEKDGSGDYSVVQQALDACAPGDTVLIGNGRYHEHESYVLPEWGHPVNVYAYVRCGGVAIIGESRGGVIIGPEEYTNDGNYGPIGVVYTGIEMGLEIVGLSVRNCYNGYYVTSGPVVVRECHVTSCWLGVIAGGGSAFECRSCVISNNNTVGVFVTGASGHAIVDCVIGDNGYGVQVGNGSSDVTIEGCEFSGDTIAVGVYASTSVRVLDNVMTGVDRGIYLQGGGHVVRGNRVEPLSSCMAILSPAYDGVVENNIFHGGSYAVVRYSGMAAQLSVRENHIIRGSGVAVLFSGFSLEPAMNIDMTGNYWGTTESDSISAWILDGYDDPETRAYVEYIPFSPVPVEAERRSHGSVKSLFR